MSQKLLLVVLVSAGLTACGGGGGSSSAGSQLNAAEYTLPGALPSVPDQAGR